MGETTIRGSLAEALSELTDPRRKQRQAHALVPILLMSVTAMLSGAKSLYAMARGVAARLADKPESARGSVVEID